jgi:hypothetical protein
MVKMKTERAGTEWLNVWVNFSGRQFIHLYKGNPVGNGRIVRGVNSNVVEAEYRHEGDEEYFKVTLMVTGLHYDGATRSGYMLGEMEHDFSELPPAKQGKSND